MNGDETDTSGLADLLDRSFGAGPAGLPTPEHRLTLGRRARRRRRLAQATAAGGLVVVVVVGGLALGLQGAGGDPSDDAVVASDPSASTAVDLSPLPTVSPSPERDRSQRLVSAQFPAAYDTDGTLVVKRGWQIVETVENPLGLGAPEASVGVVVTDGDQTRWMMLTLQRGTDEAGNPIDELGTSASADDPGKAYETFGDWLAVQASINGGPPLTPLVSVDAGDEIVPGAGASVVAVRPMPVVDGYSDPGDRMAEVRRDDGTWFVVIRGHGAEADVVGRRGHPVHADVRGPGRARPSPDRLRRGPAVSGADDRDQAYVEYVAARQAHLRRIAYAITGDWHRADDILQTALTKLYLAWPRMTDGATPDAYVRRIIVSTDLDERRRPWRRERSGLEHLDPPAPGGLPHEERTELFEALQSLPPMQRKAVVLRHWLGLSVGETAAELRISEGTVKSHTARGLTRLQAVLETTRVD